MRARDPQDLVHFPPGLPLNVGLLHPWVMQVGGATAGRAEATGVQDRVHFSPAFPFQVGLLHPGVAHTCPCMPATVPAPQDLLHFSPDFPLYVGLLHPGEIQRGQPTPPVAGTAAPAPHDREHLPPGWPFHVGLPQPGVTQSGPLGAPPVSAILNARVELCTALGQAKPFGLPVSLSTCERMKVVQADRPVNVSRKSMS